MAKLIAASVLDSDLSRLGEELKRLQRAGVDWIHLDVMDGRFVPNISFGIPVIRSIRASTGLPFDVHLMIEEPLRYVGEFRKAGADYLTLHAEACEDLGAAVDAVSETGAKVGVSLNPKTPLERVEGVLPMLDLLLFMGVEPGFGGQKFDPAVLDKIRAAKAMIDDSQSPTLIEVDGGVNPETIGPISKAGADVFVAGSFIFRHQGGVGEAVNQLRKSLI